MGSRIRPAVEVNERRCFDRSTIMWRGHAFTGRDTFNCLIWDISLGGARLQIAGDHPIDDLLDDKPLTLAIRPFGDLVGEVVWVDGPLVGVRFLAASSVVEHVLGHMLPCCRRDHSHWPSLYEVH